MNDPTPTHENPYAAPRTVSTEEAQAASGSGTLATRRSRLWATYIDGAILLPYSLGVLYLLGMFDTLLVIWTHPQLAAAETPEALPMATQLFISAGGLALFLLIQGHLLATRGQTVGKWVLGIRIVRRDGTPATLERIIFRRLLPFWALAAILPLVGALVSLLDVLLIFRPSRACLHDDLADTKVVRV